MPNKIKIIKNPYEYAPNHLTAPISEEDYATGLIGDVYLQQQQQQQPISNTWLDAIFGGSEQSRRQKRQTDQEIQQAQKTEGTKIGWDSNIDYRTLDKSQIMDYIRQGALVNVNNKLYARYTDSSGKIQMEKAPRYSITTDGQIKPYDYTRGYEAKDFANAPFPSGIATILNFVGANKGNLTPQEITQDIRNVRDKKNEGFLSGLGAGVVSDHARKIALGLREILGGQGDSFWNPKPRYYAEDLAQSDNTWYEMGKGVGEGLGQMAITGGMGGKTKLGQVLALSAPQLVTGGAEMARGDISPGQALVGGTTDIAANALTMGIAGKAAGNTKEFAKQILKSAGVQGVAGGVHGGIEGINEDRYSKDLGGSGKSTSDIMRENVLPGALQGAALGALIDVGFKTLHVSGDLIANRKFVKEVLTSDAPRHEKVAMLKSIFARDKVKNSMPFDDEGKTVTAEEVERVATEMVDNAEPHIEQKDNSTNWIVEAGVRWFTDKLTSKTKHPIIDKRFAEIGILPKTEVGLDHWASPDLASGVNTAYKLVTGENLPLSKDLPQRIKEGILAPTAEEQAIKQDAAHKQLTTKEFGLFTDQLMRGEVKFDNKFLTDIDAYAGDASLKIGDSAPVLALAADMRNIAYVKQHILPDIAKQLGTTTEILFKELYGSGKGDTQYTKFFNDVHNMSREQIRADVLDKMSKHIQQEGKPPVQGLKKKIGELANKYQEIGGMPEAKDVPFVQADMEMVYEDLLSDITKVGEEQAVKNIVAKYGIEKIRELDDSYQTMRQYMNSDISHEAKILNLLVDKYIPKPQEESTKFTVKYKVDINGEEHYIRANSQEQADAFAEQIKNNVKVDMGQKTIKFDANDPEKQVEVSLNFLPEAGESEFLKVLKVIKNTEKGLGNTPMSAQHKLTILSEASNANPDLLKSSKFRSYYQTLLETVNRNVNEAKIYSDAHETLDNAIQRDTEDLKAIQTIVEQKQIKLDKVDEMALGLKGQRLEQMQEAKSVIRELAGALKTESKTTYEDLLAKVRESDNPFLKQLYNELDRKGIQLNEPTMDFGTPQRVQTETTPTTLLEQSTPKETIKSEFDQIYTTARLYQELNSGDPKIVAMAEADIKSYLDENDGNIDTSTPLGKLVHEYLNTPITTPEGQLKFKVALHEDLTKWTEGTSAQTYILEVEAPNVEEANAIAREQLNSLVESGRKKLVDSYYNDDDYYFKQQKPKSQEVSAEPTPHEPGKSIEGTIPYNSDDAYYIKSKAKVSKYSYPETNELVKSFEEKLNSQEPNDIAFVSDKNNIMKYEAAKKRQIHLEQDATLAAETHGDGYNGTLYINNEGNVTIDVPREAPKQNGFITEEMPDSYVAHAEITKPDGTKDIRVFYAKTEGDIAEQINANKDADGYEVTKLNVQPQHQAYEFITASGEKVFLEGISRQDAIRRELTENPDGDIARNIIGLKYKNENNKATGIKKILNNLATQGNFNGMMGLGLIYLGNNISDDEKEGSIQASMGNVMTAAGMAMLGSTKMGRAFLNRFNNGKDKGLKFTPKETLAQEHFAMGITNSLAMGKFLEANPTASPEAKQKFVDKVLSKYQEKEQGSFGRNFTSAHGKYNEFGGKNEFVNGFLNARVEGVSAGSNITFTYKEVEGKYNKQATLGEQLLIFNAATHIRNDINAILNNYEGKLKGAGDRKPLLIEARDAEIKAARSPERVRQLLQDYNKERVEQGLYNLSDGTKHRYIGKTKNTFAPRLKELKTADTNSVLSDKHLNHLVESYNTFNELNKAAIYANTEVAALRATQLNMTSLEKEVAHNAPLLEAYDAKVIELQPLQKQVNRLKRLSAKQNAIEISALESKIDTELKGVLDKFDSDIDIDMIRERAKIYKTLLERSRTRDEWQYIDLWQFPRSQGQFAAGFTEVVPMEDETGKVTFTKVKPHETTNANTFLYFEEDAHRLEALGQIAQQRNAKPYLNKAGQAVQGLYTMDALDRNGKVQLNPDGSVKRVTYRVNAEIDRHQSNKINVKTREALQKAINDLIQQTSSGNADPTHVRGLIKQFSSELEPFAEMDDVPEAHKLQELLGEFDKATQNGLNINAKNILTTLASEIANTGVSRDKLATGSNGWNMIYHKGQWVDIRKNIDAFNRMREQTSDNLVQYAKNQGEHGAVHNWVGSELQWLTHHGLHNTQVANTLNELNDLNNHNSGLNALWDGTNAIYHERPNGTKVVNKYTNVGETLRNISGSMAAGQLAGSPYLYYKNRKEFTIQNYVNYGMHLPMSTFVGGLAKAFKTNLKESSLLKLVRGLDEFDTVQLKQEDIMATKNELAKNFSQDKANELLIKEALLEGQLSGTFDPIVGNAQINTKSKLINWATTFQRNAEANNRRLGFLQYMYGALESNKNHPEYLQAIRELAIPKEGGIAISSDLAKQFKADLFKKAINYTNMVNGTPDVITGTKLEQSLGKSSWGSLFLTFNKPLFNAAQLDRSLLDAVIFNEGGLRGKAAKSLLIKGAIGSFMGGAGVSVLYNTAKTMYEMGQEVLSPKDPYEKNVTPGIEEGNSYAPIDVFEKILIAGGVSRTLANQWGDYFKYGFDSMVTGYDLQSNGDLTGVANPFALKKIQSGIRLYNQHENKFAGMLDGLAKTFSPALAYKAFKGTIEAAKGYETTSGWQPQYDRPYDAGKLTQDLVMGNRIEDTQYYDKSNKVGGLNLTTDANKAKFISAVLNAAELDVGGKQPDDKVITKLLRDNKGLWDKANVIRDVIQMAWDDPQRQQEMQHSLDLVRTNIENDERASQHYAKLMNKYNTQSNPPVSYAAEAVEKLENYVKQYYYSQSVMDAVHTIDPNGTLKMQLKYPRGIDKTNGYTYAISKFLKPEKKKK